ncbi:MAG: LysM peptidoglycan-binding domain-containing protein [Clostridiales bacterium]|nr:LysM peptidoglycan-binding domain-containing protein [Clostridiales bacterium]
MNDFEFPANIKQIGSIGEGLKIYVEDYVCTYLQQYAEAGGYEERLAMLIGQTMTIDGQEVLFISGAAQGLYSARGKDMTTFTEKTFQYVTEQIRKYFGGLRIVGWMQSQPGYGMFLNPACEAYHKQNFSDSRQVLFVMDPVEKSNEFYIWNADQTKLVETHGYFIYYDKNRGMHEYMLDNKVSRLKMPPSAKQGAPEELNAPASPPEDVLRRRLNERERARREQGESRKPVGMLTSLCAVLFLVCFIMGAGLIQNDGRINAMESRITQINTAYRDLLVQLNETTAVFAQAQEQRAEGASLPAQTAEPAAETEVPAAATAAPAVTAETTPIAEAEPAPAVTAAAPIAEASAPAEIVIISTVQVPDTYTIQAGDSLIGISERFYGTKDMVERIMEANNLTDPNMILFGQVLKLPK